MKTIEEIFDDVTLIGETPNLIMKVKLPDKIFDDKSWIEPCRKIKDDPYAALLNHINVGLITILIKQEFLKNILIIHFFLDI